MAMLWDESRTEQSNDGNALHWVVASTAAFPAAAQLPLPSTATEPVPLSRQELLSCVETEAALKSLKEPLELRMATSSSEGQTLADEARAIEEERKVLKAPDKRAVEDVEEEVTSPDDALRGQLRITCSVSFAYAQIADAIVDFLKLHPQLKVDLNASEGALNLVETRIDLAIRISAEPDPALIGRVLAPCTSVLVASPAYLADRGVPLVE